MLLALQTFDYQEQSVKGVFGGCALFILFLGYSAKNEKVSDYFVHFYNQKRLEWLPIDQQQPRVNRNQVLPSPMAETGF